MKLTDYVSERTYQDMAILTKAINGWAWRNRQAPSLTGSSNNPINRSFFMTATNLYVLRIFRPTVLRSLKIRVFMRIYSWQRKYGQKEGMRLLILFIDYWNANWLRASDLKPMRLSSSYTTALSICG